MSDDPTWVERFGELRSLLQREPDERAFEALCALLQAWPARGAQRQALALPYARDHLARGAWGALDAPAPAAWLEALGREPDDSPLASLMTEITLAPRSPLELEQAQRWAQAPWDRLRRMSLRHAPRSAAALEALGRGRWPALRWLDLRACELDDEAASALARWSMPALRMLDLGHNAISAAGLQALSQASWWPQLESLTLGHDSMSSRMMVELVEHMASQPSLTWLRLDSWPMDWPTARALGDASVTSRLESISLGSTRMGADELGALFIGSSWPKLRILSLARNRLGAVAMRVLDRLGALGELAQLDLSFNELDASCVERSVLLGELEPRLRALDLSRNPLGDEGVQRLAQRGSWGELRRLELTGTQLGPLGAWTLAHGPWVHGLERLGLSVNALGGAGVRTLHHGVSWPALRSLELRMTRLDPKGLGELLEAQPEHMPALGRLDVSLNGLQAGEPSQGLKLIV